MKKILQDVFDEIKQFVNGKTIDTIVPPLVYLVANQIFDLKVTALISIGVAAAFAIYRLYKKETILYSLGGLAGVLVAAGTALLSGSAENYFLPGIISSGFMFIASLMTVIVGRPLAAIFSHLSRSWDFKWFMRKDIKPAYREVTLAWSFLFLLRMLLQILLLKRGNLAEITWINIMLGLPATLIVLVFTLIYGTWRLQKLGGPGIDEFEEEKPPPWRGQKKGF